MYRCSSRLQFVVEESDSLVPLLIPFFPVPGKSPLRAYNKWNLKSNHERNRSGEKCLETSQKWSKAWGIYCLCVTLPGFSHLKCGFGFHEIYQQQSCAKADLSFLDLKIFVNVDPLYNNLTSGLLYHTDLFGASPASEPHSVFLSLLFRIFPVIPWVIQWFFSKFFCFVWFSHIN